MIRILPVRPLDKGALVHLLAPSPALKNVYLDFIRKNATYHYPWIIHTETSHHYEDYLERIREGRVLGFFLFSNDTNELVGVINLNNILMGAVRSASLGYYGAAQVAGKGYMREGLKLVLKFAVNKAGLHRIEANIQPGNSRSIALVKSLGFRKEGFSPEYLHINGQWRDHERWAILESEVAKL
tara:strand:- start:7524 stop:8075 length:552 start_codon:yes stop_codon:yes gene_type:complete